MVYTEDGDLACRNVDVLRGLGTIKLSLHNVKVSKAPLKNPSYPDGPIDQAPIPRALEAELDMTERTA